MSKGLSPTNTSAICYCLPSLLPTVADAIARSHLLLSTSAVALPPLLQPFHLMLSTASVEYSVLVAANADTERAPTFRLVTLEMLIVIRAVTVQHLARLFFLLENLLHYLKFKVII